EGKDVFRRWVIDDRIRVVGSFDLAGYFQRLRIEYKDFPFVTIGDEALAISQCDSMTLLQTGNRTHNVTGVSVNHFDLSAVRDIHASCTRIRKKVVEIFSASGRSPEGNFFDEVISDRLRTRQNTKIHNHYTSARHSAGRKKKFLHD